jgi:ubiquinone/menaquinone biosynthesis C-methylase UbiE
VSRSVEKSYNSAAEAYAEQLFNELEKKPLDRHLLNRFAESVKGKGLVADLGCGPGHIAKYLHSQGVEMCGIDISPEMIRIAKEMSPEVDFKAGDMLSLDAADESLAGIVAFYSIVHFDSSQLATALSECRRVMKDGALILLAFHIGDEVIHVDDLFDRPVNLDFRFHRPADVMNALRSYRFTVIESTEREPYEGAEHQSRRSYLLARAD